MQHLTWHLKAMCHSSGKSPNNFLTRPLHKLNQDEIILIHQQDTGHQKREDHHGEECHIATLPHCHVATLPHCHTEGQGMMTSLCGERKNQLPNMVCDHFHWNILMCWIMVRVALCSGLSEYGLWSFSLEITDALNHGQPIILLCYIQIWPVIIFTERYWRVELWPEEYIAVLYFSANTNPNNRDNLAGRFTGARPV